MHDLVIVGGGPAGLHLAYRMAAAGHRTVVLDSRPQIGSHRICAGIIGAEVFSHLDLPRNSILRDLQSIRFVAPSGTTIDYEHEGTMAHIVDRCKFDMDLAKRAEAAGAQIVSAAHVRKLFVNSRKVHIETSASGDAGQYPCVFEARLLALATGVITLLNHMAGLGCPSSFLYAVQGEVALRKGVERTHCFTGRDVAPGGFGWMVPVNGHARVGLMAERDPRACFEELIKRIAPFREAPDDPVTGSHKRIVQTFSGNSYADRALAVGEAAGQIKTTTGGGIYYSLLGAEHAFSVLSQAFETDRYDAGFLSEYERRWQAQLKHEQNAGLYYRQLFTSLPDRKLDALFKVARINGVMPLIQRTADFDWHKSLLNSVGRYGLVKRILGLPRSP